jgi:hypothetical protein
MITKDPFSSIVVVVEGGESNPSDANPLIVLTVFGIECVGTVFVITTDYFRRVWAVTDRDNFGRHSDWTITYYIVRAETLPRIRASRETAIWR